MLLLNGEEFALEFLTPVFKIADAQFPGKSRVHCAGLGEIANRFFRVILVPALAIGTNSADASRCE